MTDFLGRKRELAILHAELARVRAPSERPGRCLMLRGRRRVGKSRLVEVFCQQAQVPLVFYAAAGVSLEQELARFAEEVRHAELPGSETLEGMWPQSWEAGLRLLAQALPDDGPSIVVLDEVPYLAARDPGFEGTLQRVWDRVLSHRQVLFILIGSDLSMMEALDSYGRPFHQRGKPLVLAALNPLDVGSMLDLAPVDAFDAYLVTGGLPLVCSEWGRGASVAEFLHEALAAPTSALLVSGERALAAEFPVEAQARAVLSAIGSGERTYTGVRRAAGGLPQGSLARALELLTAKRVVAADRPLSTKPSRETRYRVTDAYLRFWLHFLGPHIEEVDRGRGDRIMARLDAGWTSWRGRAIEPVVRESIRRLVPDGRLPAAGAVGGFWTRTNDVEVDLVGADRQPVASSIAFVGSIKWHARQPFDHHDLAALLAHRLRVPGADSTTPLVAVSRSGFNLPHALDAAYGPGDLLEAWSSLDD